MGFETTQGSVSMGEAFSVCNEMVDDRADKPKVRGTAAVSKVGEPLPSPLDAKIGWPAPDIAVVRPLTSFRLTRQLLSLAHAMLSFSPPGFFQCLLKIVFCYKLGKQFYEVTGRCFNASWQMLKAYWGLTLFVLSKKKSNVTLTKTLLQTEISINWICKASYK